MASTTSSSIALLVCAVAFFLCQLVGYVTSQCACTSQHGNGPGGAGCLSPTSGPNNVVCKNGYGDFGPCVPPTGCPEAGTVPVPVPLNTNLSVTAINYMEPVPRWSYIYECQNSTLFLGVFNVSLTGFGYLLEPRNVWVNTVTCITAVPAFHRGAQVFDATTYNSCDNAGGCGNCNNCNCSCRVTNPWWWNCCYDPCFGCYHCCGCNSVTWNFQWWNGDGSCSQCFMDGWCGYPNGQMLTPTVCQFAVAAMNPGNRLDYESLSASNFTYQLRVVQRTIGCSACNAIGYLNLTIYVKDCNEWPIFQNPGRSMQTYEYDGASGVMFGSTFNIFVTDPDVFNITYNTFDLAVERVTLNNVQVNSIPWYITNSHAVSTNLNASTLMYDASRCGAQIQLCLDLFKYAYSGATPPIFRISVIASDGGGAISTATYTVTILQIPSVPVWANLPATVSVIEDTAGLPTQIYPMEAVIPGYVAAVNTVSFLVIDVNPAVANTGLKYIDNGGACSPAAPSSVQCNALVLTTNVVAGTLVYATQKTYNVTVWCTNKIAGSATIYTISSSIIVNILQRVYQPTLTPSSDTVWIKENVTTAACVYNITGATSVNVGRTLPNFLFTLFQPVTPPTNTFYLVNNYTVCYDGTRQSLGSGVTLGWIFDYSIVPIYTLQVTVSDPLSIMVPNTFTLTVSIINVENPITISAPAYQIIPETATTWTFVATGTKEVNQQAMTFLLTGQTAANHNQMWQISSQTSTVASAAATCTIFANPALSNTQMFNWTVAPIIYLNVTAYTAQYTVSTLCTFYIQRINNAPFFTNLPNITSIAEAITGYVTIFTTSTSDRESDPVQVYFRNPTTGVLSAYDPSGKFYIDPVLKVITTFVPSGTTGYNYYTTPVYTLTVCCVDSPPSLYTPGTSTSTFVVFIVLNQTAPTFTTPLPGAGQVGATISPNVKESATGTANLLTIAAVDRESDYIYYNITDIRPVWNTAFTLMWPGTIFGYNQSLATSNPMFNNSAYPVYYIVLECSDHKTNPTSTTTLTVSIDRVDKPAQWTDLNAYVSVREDVYWGPTDLITVGAIDPNGKYPVTINYLSMSPSSGSTKLYYDSSTQAVGYYLNPQFAYGVVNSYVLLFTAFNTVLPTITGQVVVQILPVNNGPLTNPNSSTVYLHENVTVAQTLWDLRAKDNSSLTLRYFLADSVPQAIDKFSVVNGLIKSKDSPKFNYQTAPSYLIYAGMANAAGQTATFTLTVSIIDDPEPPVITNLPSSTTVRETTTGNLGGGLFYTKCVDEDGRALTWSYAVLPSSGSTNFNISSTGVITTTAAAKFSYLTTPYYYVIALCSNGYYTATGTLTVMISWTTTTSTSTAKPRTTHPDTYDTTTTNPEGDLLTPEQIGAIVGSLLGALCLAGGAYGIARYLQQRAKADGTLDSTKRVPVHQMRSWKM